MSIDFKNNIKFIRMTSPGGNCPEPCFAQCFLQYIPICNQVCFQFCFQVREPVISTSRPIICHFVRNEKSLLTYLIHENSNCQHFLFLKKTIPKMDKFFKLLPYSKGRHFSITKLDTFIFCNILHLEMDFSNLS